MCEACWSKFNPVEISTSVESLAALINKIYRLHGAGGSLHIILDDWNLDDSSIEFCTSAIRSNRYNESRKLLKLEAQCIELLKKSDIDTRATALAYAKGYIKIPLF